MNLEKLSSSIYNNVMSGLRGVTINSPFTLEQIEDDIIDERLKIIKDYARLNLIPVKDLTYSIRCIDVDCESLDRCPCSPSDLPELKHFEIPQVFAEFGDSGIDFVGSTDGMIEYTTYTNNLFKQHKYKRRGANKAYVWIDTTPNANNMLDGFIFNAPPMLKSLLVRVIPKDPRDLAKYNCCGGEIENKTFLDSDIKDRLSRKYLEYYRRAQIPITPNDQTVKQ